MNNKRNTIAGFLASCLLVFGIAAPVMTTPAFAQDEDEEKQKLAELYEQLRRSKVPAPEALPTGADPRH